VTPQELLAELVVDDGLAPAELTEVLVRELARLNPHGEGNPPPVFRLDGIVVRSAWTMGQDRATLGLALGLPDGRELRGVGFGLGARRPATGAQVSLAARPVFNEYRGTRSLELQVLDLREEGA